MHVTRPALLPIAIFALITFAACSSDPSEPRAEDDVAILDGSDPSDGSIDVPDPDAGEDPSDDSEHDPTDDALEDTSDDAQTDGDAMVDDALDDATEPPTRCDFDEECDDFRPCTVDTCSAELGHCVWSVAEGSCFADGECFETGGRSADAPCRVCNPDIDAFGLVAVADGGSCDDGDLCTGDTICVEGACVGASLVCQDRNPCTEDLCDPVLGCYFEPIPTGAECDDGNACTVGEVCNADGECAGEPVSCDDSDACTDDSCDERTGCRNVDNTAPCDDGDPCTAGDTCAEGSCVAGGATSCDDFNGCTIDFCDEFAGCVNIPNLTSCCAAGADTCNDRDPCTTDGCSDEDGSCVYTFNTAPCDDGNACTEGDVCSEGECSGSTRECEDGNPCTADYCDEEDGCTFEPIDGGECDDGISCTFEETCVAGSCVAGRNECVCDPVFGETAVKLTGLRIGNGGQPGEALDLDRDPTTCAPAANCSDGRHNALGAIGPIANGPIGEAVTEGSLMLILDVDDIRLNPFTIALHQGELAPGDAGCDYQSEECDYLLSRGGFDSETCAPEVTLPATRSGSTVVAGGPGTIFPLDVPFGESTLTFTLYDVRFEGTVTVDGDQVTSLQGVIGGAVPRTLLIETLESLSADDLGGLDPNQIISLLQLFVIDDIDTDGDGRADAASIGIPVIGIGANVVGAD